MITSCGLLCLEEWVGQSGKGCSTSAVLEEGTCRQMALPGPGCGGALVTSQAGGHLTIILTEEMWQQESQKVATGASGSSPREKSEAGYPDPSA